MLDPTYKAFCLNNLLVRFWINDAEKRDICFQKKKTAIGLMSSNLVLEASVKLHLHESRPTVLVRLHIVSVGQTLGIPLRPLGRYRNMFILT